MMNIYVIFCNNTPPRCSDPGQTLLFQQEALLGSLIPNIPLTDMGLLPKPIPTLGNVQCIAAHRGEKNNRMQSALQTHKNPKTSSILCQNIPIRAWTIQSSCCPLWRPRLQLQIQQNKAKPSS